MNVGSERTHQVHFLWREDLLKRSAILMHECLKAIGLEKVLA